MYCISWCFCVQHKSYATLLDTSFLDPPQELIHSLCLLKSHDRLPGSSCSDLHSTGSFLGCRTSSEQDSGAPCCLVIHILQTPRISFRILHYAFGLKSTWNKHWRECSSEHTVCLTGPLDCFSKNSNNLGTDSPVQLFYIFIVFHSTTSFFITSSSILTPELH